MGKGNVLFHDSLTMNSRQKTWSFAVSRSMLPEVKVIVYGVLDSGEVLSDSLSLHVNGIRSNGVS